MAEKQHPVDPAQFIVRHDLYPQKEGYARACAKIAEMTLAHDFPHINALLGFIQDCKDELPLKGAYAEKYWATRNGKNPNFPHYSELDTSIVGKYSGPFRRELLEKDIEPTHEEQYVRRVTQRTVWKGSETSPGDVTLDVPLTKYRLPRVPPEKDDTRDNGRIYHPDVHDIEGTGQHDGVVITAAMTAEERADVNARQKAVNASFAHEPGIASPMGTGYNSCDAKKYQQEHRWSQVAQAYTALCKNPKGSREAKEAALTCYSLLSHATDVPRGNATLSRIALEYLAHKAGFEVPFTKKGYDLNTEALRRTPEEFIRDWDKGEYFDPQATSEAVMEWQRKKLAVCNDRWP